jgi:hypothetical protein
MSRPDSRRKKYTIARCRPSKSRDGASRLTIPAIISVDDLLQDYYAWVVNLHEGDRVAAARAVGVDQKTIYNRLLNVQTLQNS